MKHTKEPWQHDVRGAFELNLDSQDGMRIAEFLSASDAARAHACVNALAGIEDPDAFVKAADKLAGCSHRQPVATHPPGKCGSCDRVYEWNKEKGEAVQNYRKIRGR